MGSSKGSGDDGYTGLLGQGRVPKYHPRPDAFGTVDEASAALGLARSLTENAQIAGIAKTIQRDLYVVMTELAAAGQASNRCKPLDAGRVGWLEEQIEVLEVDVTLPDEFVLGGDVPASAAFDLARTVVRRAERLVAKLYHEKEVRNIELLRYLNRLSSLCYLLSIKECQLADVDRPTRAKSDSA
jgi:cob(I)alamin adenosyltransferase